MRYYELPGITKKVSNLGLGTIIFHPDKKDICEEIAIHCLSIMAWEQSNMEVKRRLKS